MRVPFSIKPRTSNLKLPVTSRYRHDALLCVHQVALAPLRLSSIQATREPGVRSSDPLFPVRPLQSAHFYPAASAICLLPSLSHLRRIFFAEIPSEQRKVWRFRLHLLPAMARAPHFHLRPVSVILQLGVPQATVKVGLPAAFARLGTEKGSRWAVAAVSFVARSSPETGRFAFLLSALCRCWIGFVTVDLAIAAADPFCLVDLAAVVAVSADPASGLAVAVSVDSAASASSAAGLDFAVAAGLDFFAVLVCPFAA